MSTHTWPTTTRGRAHVARHLPNACLHVAWPLGASAMSLFWPRWPPTPDQGFTQVHTWWLASCNLVKWFATRDQNLGSNIAVQPLVPSCKALRVCAYYSKCLPKANQGFTQVHTWWLTSCHLVKWFPTRDQNLGANIAVQPLVPRYKALRV